MLRLFFAYSHVDQEFRDDLETHLTMLKRQGLLEAWHDRRITAGEELHGKIGQKLEEAHIVLLLVSPYFLASDYCYDVEMTRALERHAKGEARVIPVIVHPCDWQHAPFGHLRATPTDGKPISKFSNKHDAFLEIAQDIRRVASELPENRGAVTARAPESRTVSTLSSPEAPRSSNLRMKHEFSDRERDKFREGSFEYIARFFENSLAELALRQEGVEGSFRRTDSNHFAAAVYVHGEKRASCRIWRGSSMIGDIAYASGDSGDSNSYNEALSVVDDGNSLLLRPYGLQMLGNATSSLSQ